MRNSTLSKFLILLVCTACVSIRPDGIVKSDRGSSVCLKTDSTLSTPFRDKVPRAIFRASLDVRGHHLTGQLYLKKMADSTMRIAFTNEFGMTWFDFILKNDQITVAYCFEPMNKKALHRILKTNFELLFSATTSLGTAQVFTQENTGRTVVRGRFGKYRTWYTLDTPTCMVGQISGKSGLPDKTLITCSDFHDGVPDSVVVKTPVIGMVMKLAREK